MAGVKAEEFFVFKGVTQIKLMAADDITFRADAEKFALDRVEIMAGIQLLREGLPKPRMERVGPEKETR